MGLGIVLIAFGFLGVCASFPFAWICIVLARQNRQPGDAGGTNLIAGCLPFVLLAYGALAFVVYAGWCSYRGVDPSVGDGWYVPLGDHYELLMIDTTENARIAPSGGGEAIIRSSITRIASSGEYIIGESSSDGVFTFDVRTGARATHLSWDDVTAKFSPPPVLQTTGSFYLARRWSWVDLLALVILSAPAVVIMREWWRVFISPLPERKTSESI